MRPSLYYPAILLLGLAFALGACRAPECQQMLDCCEHVEDLDGVGGACGQMAEETRDPQTCRDVVRTIGYMLEERDEPIPNVCDN